MLKAEVDFWKTTQTYHAINIWSAIFKTYKFIRYMLFKLRAIVLKSVQSPMIFILRNQIESHFSRVKAYSKGMSDVFVKFSSHYF